MNKKSKIWFLLTISLQNQDTEQQTYGCRHSNPDICNACYIENICAFSSPDQICKRPSKSWRKYYLKLKKEILNDKHE